MTNKKPATPAPRTARTRRYFIRDPRQRSPFGGKPEGGWLRYPPSPAVWVRSRLEAHTFTAEEVEAIQKEAPYFEGCDVILADEDADPGNPGQAPRTHGGKHGD